jgi:hypothetical protein
MTQTVWKFPLLVCDDQIILMPDQAEILCVQRQGELACLWALVDPHETLVPRRFFVVGTGHELPQRNLKYVGTFQTDDGVFVWHVFEVRGVI